MLIDLEKLELDVNDKLTDLENRILLAKFAVDSGADLRLCLEQANLISRELKLHENENNVGQCDSSKK